MTAPRPRVFIDGRNLALSQGTGVATYARNLSQTLGRLGYGVGVLYGNPAAPSVHPLLREVSFFDDQPDDSPTWLIAARIAQSLLYNAAIGPAAKPVPVTGKVITANFKDRLPHFDEIWNATNVFEQGRARFRMFGSLLRVRVAQRPAVMHWTYPLPLFVPGSRNIYTLHDLVPLRLPYTTLDRKRYYLRMHRVIGARARHIVTVSENSKRDIVNLLGVPEERVTNTYQAVDVPRAFREAPLQAVHDEIAGSFGLTPGRFWLFFGAIEPKKNVGRMIQAFLASGVEGPLVIVGKKAWKSEEELRLLFDDHVRFLVQEGAALRTRHRVMMLDYVPFRLLVGLIRAARGVLFPSLYEGFGLPALEAMQLGTPVVTSNTASMPEVVGDAALTVDPYSVGALVEAIQAVDRDDALRGRLAVDSPRRAALFSPERYAARIAALYGQLGVAAPSEPLPLPRALAAE